MCLEFDANLMNDINDYISNEAENMLFIYGGNDTWSASAVTLSGKTNSVKMVKEGGNHRTRIKSFEGNEKEMIYSTLEKWLNEEITP